MRSWAAGRVSEVMSPSCGRNRSPPDRFTGSVVGVRADRLMAILLLLQQREQVTAAEVARELEVYRGRQRATTSTRQAQGATGRGHRLDHGTYVTVSLLTGARTEKLRALTWSNVDLDGKPAPTSRSCRTCGYGGRSGPAARPRPGPRGEPSPYRIVRSSRSASNTTARPTLANAQGPDGPPTMSCSRRRTAPPSTLPTSDAASATPPPAWTRCLDAPPAAAQLRLAAARRRRPDRTDRPPDRPRRRIEGHRRRLPQTAATGHRRGRDSHEPRLPGRPWP